MSERFDLREPNEAALSAAERALGRGELVVLPTDTVYGVAARPDAEGATDRLFAAKRRPRDLTLPVLVADTDDAERIARFDGRARALAERFWPGALTMVLPRTEASLPWMLGDERDTVGIRLPADDIARALLTRTGPLAVTSANVSGEPTPATCEGVEAAFGQAVAVYLCSGTAPGGRASTVVDLTGAEPVVLRRGPISPQAILDTAAGDTP
ncbi:MAG TPA: L-threonylcarbamoyladenylate synthase [Actinomycetota bacterium]|nr:L-threonylcarbamoyladenylate synthase [Actinomycetota bacterium]